jgi:UDP-glucose 4-epimerase
LIKSFEDTSGVTIKFKYLSRREGDLLAFWADTSKALKKISWQSERNIKNVCEDTWRWHQKNPIGYGKKK